jgi:tetratricopeptide (TPR) repeat protein
MAQRDVDEFVEIRCNCGALVKFVRDALGDVAEAMTCPNCGSRVKVHSIDVGSERHKFSTTIFASGAHAPVRDLRTQNAVDLVREKKYTEAIQQYEEILSREPTHRDIFYGLGFCFYKLNRLQEAVVLLRVAHDMGHPHAEPLMHKAEAKIHGREPA